MTATAAAVTALRQQLVQALQDTAEMRGAQIVRQPADDMVLLESGLDSLGFAILVAKLEEELGLDPFAAMDEPVYPRTWGEFVAIYERFAR